MLILFSSFFLLICRTKILAVDLTSKKEQIGNLKQQTKDLENELQRQQEAVTRAQLKFTDLVKLFSVLQQELKTQRATLSDIKVAVQKNHKSALEHHKKLVINVDLLCKKFAEEKCALEDSLRKVRAKLNKRTLGSFLSLFFFPGLVFFFWSYFYS